MKLRLPLLFAALSVELLPCVAHAQIVRSGSNGSLGALVATNQGDVLIHLPADGRLHYTSVLIGQSTTVRFSRNPMNTPVYLLASSNVVIGGIIEIGGSEGGQNKVGSGGPGGFDGGRMGFNGPPGDGEGPGGGIGGYYFGGLGTTTNPAPGAGSFATMGLGASGGRYGNQTLVPLIGGSGGAGMGDQIPDGSNYGGGGGGGGAMLIASDVGIHFVGGTGTINANGGNGYIDGRRYTAGGSGGAVRLVAPRVSGSGYINARGGQEAGRGRIRIDDAFQDNSIRLDGIAREAGNFEVFPQIVPSLRVLEVAGRAIPENAGATVQISLSRNAPTNQTLRLRAKDFSGFVPIVVAVIPEQGPSSRYVGEIDMGGSNVAESTLNIVLTPGTVNRIQAWTQ